MHPAPTLPLGAAPRDAARINLAWLLGLRWGIWGGEVAVVTLADRALGIAVPLVPLYAIAAVAMVTNGLVMLRTRRPWRACELVATAVLLLDVGLLTAVLHLTGAAANPFSVLFLVYVALGAVVLRTRSSLLLFALSAAGYGSLFLWPEHGAHAGHSDMRMHLEGMWVAFAIAAALVVYFVTRLRAALGRREREIEVAREDAARAERLASLGTLAAGAAHELSTPLGTIGVAAREIERELARRAGDSDLAADVALIRSEVDRCRDILSRMAADTGAARGERLVAVSVGEVVARAAAGLPTRPRIATVPDALFERRFMLARDALAHALSGIMRNAQQASEPDAEVRVEVSEAESALTFAVHDEGSGISSSLLGRVGEPFFTTKPPGSGMGLGVFLARALARELGGRLHIESELGRGTSVRLTVSAQPAPARQSQPGMAPMERIAAPLVRA